MERKALVTSFLSSLPCCDNCVFAFMFCVLSFVLIAEDGSTYQVQEYFSYNEYSFYDLENVIDASGRRQVQPDPRVKYHHTDPWKTAAETSPA